MGLGHTQGGLRDARLRGFKISFTYVDGNGVKRDYARREFHRVWASLRNQRFSNSRPPLVALPATAYLPVRVPRPVLEPGVLAEEGQVDLADSAVRLRADSTPGSGLGFGRRLRNRLNAF